ncbi:MAG TPA: AMP-binding protein, partial [Candidatus Baltobacteraceae bacterium]|nr:AMP-binding protein [Candidatus Baltobacteraceae bacterium]
MTAHVDRFCADALPPRTKWPDLLFDLPELRFDPVMNASDRLLDVHVREGRGGRRCILSPDLTWTYAQLQQKANQIARVLVEEMDVVPGNRVLLRGFNSPMLAACWFAVLKAGAVAVTAMPLYRAAELQTIQEKVRVEHALCDIRLADELNATENRDRLRTLFWGNGELEAAMDAKPDSFENVPTAAEDVAIIGFTSGTTGKPKAAAHFHRDLIATCETYGRHVLQVRPDDLIAGSPPLGFTFGLGGLLLFPLHAGAATLLLEKAQPEPLLQAIAQHKVTTIFTAPVAYRAMTDMLEAHDIRSLRSCVSAGETLPKPVWDAWHAATGLRILDGIGSTEMLHIFIGSPEDRVVAGSTGQPVPGYIAQIHDDSGNEVARGEIGRLAVKGPTGCKYLDD